MKLLARFNLIFIVIVLVGLSATFRFAYSVLMESAKAQVRQQAELMIESAKATRTYTSDELKPLLMQLPKHNTKFLPQTVPAYAATTTFKHLRQRFPEYTYKEAALNPTNLLNRATDWEADIIQHFRNHQDQHELVGERSTPAGRTMFLARPMLAVPSCLECHSVPSKAPKAMLARYGDKNGFGWTLNEPIAAQIVSVPMTVPENIAWHAFQRLMFYLVITLVTTLLAIDYALYKIVIVPVQKLSVMADKVSRGEMDAPEIPVRGSDEISTLTAAFNRMYVSVRKALDLLNS